MIPLARVALVRLVRDRSNLFFVAVLPLMIVLLIGLSFGQAGDESTRVLVVGAADDAVADEVATLLADDGLDVGRSDDAAARAAVEAGEADAAVVVPEGTDAAAGATATVEVVMVADGDEQALVALVDGAVAAATGPVRAARALTTLGVEVDPGDLPDVADDVVALTRTVVDAPEEGSLEQEFQGLGQFDLGASSQLLLFVFLTALTASAGIVQARRWGIVDRVLAGPTGSSAVVGGLGLGQLTVALGQALLIVGVTAIAFDVNWGDPVAASAVVLTFSAVSALAGLLIGAVLDNEEQAGGLGPPIGIGLGALGGCMLPLEFFPDWLLPIAYATPHAWANTAFAEIVRRDGSVTDVLPELLVLVAFAVVLGTAATVVLRRRITRA